MGKGMEALMRGIKQEWVAKNHTWNRIQTEAASCCLGVCMALEVHHVFLEGQGLEQEALNQVILTAPVRGAFI